MGELDARILMTVRMLTAVLFGSMAFWIARIPISMAQFRPSEFNRAEQAEIEARVKAQIQDESLKRIAKELGEVRDQIRAIDQEHKEIRNELTSVKWAAVGFGAALSALHLVGLLLGRFPPKQP